jgi:PadR family transcriptional regulator AphA
MTNQIPATGSLPPVDLPLDMLALGLLMRGPAHGYKLFVAYQHGFGEIWVAGRSRFYAALARLPDRGLARVRVEPQAGRPARRVYSITPSGRKRFLAWLYEPVTPVRAVRVVFLAKLRFFEMLRLPRAEKLISAQRRVSRAGLVQLERRAASAASSAADHFGEVLFAFRVHQTRAVLDWLIWVARRTSTRRNGGLSRAR